MDEKSKKVHIIHYITDFLIPEGTTENDIEGQATGFSGNFIGDHIPSIVQVTNSSFKNIKVNVPSLIAIKQTMDARVLTNQTLMLHDGYITKETVPTFFPFPGSWKDNLMERPQSAAYILNVINNKIVAATNKVKTTFIQMMAWLRAGTVQASRSKKHASTAI